MSIQEVLEKIKSYRIILRSELYRAIGKTEANKLIKLGEVITFQQDGGGLWYVKLPGME
jgi:hypothetical protein